MPTQEYLSFREIGELVHKSSRQVNRDFLEDPEYKQYVKGFPANNPTEKIWKVAKDKVMSRYGLTGVLGHDLRHDKDMSKADVKDTLIEHLTNEIVYLRDQLDNKEKNIGILAKTFDKTNITLNQRLYEANAINMGQMLLNAPKDRYNDIKTVIYDKSGNPLRDDIKDKKDDDKTEPIKKTSHIEGDYAEVIKEDNFEPQEEIKVEEMDDLMNKPVEELIDESEPNQSDEKVNDTIQKELEEIKHEMGDIPKTELRDLIQDEPDYQLNDDTENQIEQDLKRHGQGERKIEFKQFAQNELRPDPRYNDLNFTEKFVPETPKDPTPENDTVTTPEHDAVTMGDQKQVTEKLAAEISEEQGIGEIPIPENLPIPEVDNMPKIENYIPEAGETQPQYFNPPENNNSNSSGEAYAQRQENNLGV